MFKRASDLFRGIRGLLGSARALQIVKPGSQHHVHPHFLAEGPICHILYGIVGKTAAIWDLEYIAHLEVCQVHEQLAAVASNWTMLLRLQPWIRARP